MKSNSPLAFSWFKSWVLAIAIVIIAAMTTAKAQTLVDVINGLFTPTQSERFFQAGREAFEREVEIFNHPERYLRDDLLQIKPKSIERMHKYQQSFDFAVIDPQYELYQDLN